VRRGEQTLLLLVVVLASLDALADAVAVLVLPVTTAAEAIKFPRATTGNDRIPTKKQ
jgi:hypothetical protein